MTRMAFERIGVAEMWRWHRISVTVVSQLRVGIPQVSRISSPYARRRSVTPTTFASKGVRVPQRCDTHGVRSHNCDRSETLIPCECHRCVTPMRWHATSVTDRRYLQRVHRALFKCECCLARMCWSGISATNL